MRKLRSLIPLIAALVIAVFGQAWAPSQLARPNMLTVVPTTSGPYLCGPAFVIETMEGQYGRPMPFGNAPAMAPTRGLYPSTGGSWSAASVTPWGNRHTFLPPESLNAGAMRCRPMFTPRPSSPVSW